MEKRVSSIEVVPVPLEQQPVLANLLELYIHDFSEFHPVEIGADGRYGYPRLPLYWSDPNRYPFLIYSDRILAGFALVHRTSDAQAGKLVWDMAEFFVLRSHRRQGIGMHAALRVFHCFPGLWQVRVMQSNLSAQHFWSEAIFSFAGRTIQPLRFTHGGDGWQRFSFESSSAFGSIPD